ncbi:MAG: hypothetical protein IPJ89_02665 [Candidatus Iainarchaeum archaeon]|uniref:Uncharacterized protein n=1 Tax=Candidatus Iainarchaeum sp. TaxID=3101447 RepID=A0A7T9DKP9_9ARCH|nr:MAG: hypothetical protein IPJ89_02665 [Candidatus Diapherotrites archaeon]
MARTPMNQRGLFFLQGTLIEGTILVIIIVMLLPTIITLFIPQFDWIFKLVLIFSIYSFVRGFLGDSSLTLLLSGILIYFMAFKYAEIFTSLWFISVILGFGLSNLLVLAAKDVLGFQKPVVLGFSHERDRPH